MNVNYTESIKKVIGSRQDWAKAYLKHFVIQAEKRAGDMITKFVKPFEKYIK